jgi:nitrogen regulatory protein PII
LNLVGGVTLTDVRGCGNQRGASEHSLGLPLSIRFRDKIKLEVAVAAADAQEVLTLISQLAYTGRFGDGKIFISDVLMAMRIRTGELGLDAL